MNTSDIPTSVTVIGGLYAGVYTSKKESKADTWSWYPSSDRPEIWPHVTVGMSDDAIVSTSLHPLLPLPALPGAGESEPAGPVLTLKKYWWRKLHVTVSITGTNLQMFYAIDSNWLVTPRRHNMQHIPSSKQDVAQSHANRQATDYKNFAQSFINAARSAWKAGLEAGGGPKVTKVGPQTDGAFARGDGL